MTEVPSATLELPVETETLLEVSAIAISDGDPPQTEPAPETRPPPPPKPEYPPYSWRTIGLTAQEPKLIYITNHLEANEVLAQLDEEVLGFDLEWKPTWYKGGATNKVALVQLACPHTILLLHLKIMQIFPSKLKQLLENPGVTKAGVGIDGDCKKLFEDWRVSVRSCVDLSLFARSVDNARWKGKYTNPIGLARLVETYENLSLGKVKRIRCSNWELSLSPDQQEYAANDAHSGYVLYSRLLTMSQSLEIIPDKVCYTFDAISGRLCRPDGEDWHPENPHYDPGPPPPPRPPRPPRAPRPAREPNVRDLVNKVPVRTYSDIASGKQQRNSNPGPNAGSNFSRFQTQGSPSGVTGDNHMPPAGNYYDMKPHDRRHRPRNGHRYATERTTEG